MSSLNVPSRLVVVVGVIILLLCAACAARAEQVPVQSACLTDTKGMTKNAKKFIDTECQIELKNLQKVDDKKIGSASKNGSVTTVTMRASFAGVETEALEGSKEWAAYQKEMAKQAVNLEKAKHPAPKVIYPFFGNGYGYGYSQPVVVVQPTATVQAPAPQAPAQSVRPAAPAAVPQMHTATAPAIPALPGTPGGWGVPNLPN